jgi:prephenate dehydrogenase
VHLAFLGLGQIGGSVARAALAAGFAERVAAWTPSGAGPRAAIADGIVTAASPGEAIRGADVVILAAPPLDCLALLDDLAGQLGADLRPDAVITDVASTKAEIVGRAAALGLRFVGGHPMAGRETSGYTSADPGLFHDRPWLIVPLAAVDDPAVARVEALAIACGARPIRIGAAEHDAATALISHAPLALSAALVEAAAARPEWPLAAAIAAGGWTAMTRLALGDPAMGAGILATNAAATGGALRSYREAIDSWIALLDDGADPAELLERLAAARAVAGRR